MPNQTIEGCDVRICVSSAATPLDRSKSSPANRARKTKGTSSAVDGISERHIVVEYPSDAAVLSPSGTPGCGGTRRPLPLGQNTTDVQGRRAPRLRWRGPVRWCFVGG